MSSGVACQAVALCEGLETSLAVWLGSSGYLGLERFDALTSRSLSLRPSRQSRGFPSRSILHYALLRSK